MARPDALLRLAEAKAAPPPYSPDSWISYGGGAAILWANGPPAAQVAVAKG